MGLRTLCLAFWILGSLLVVGSMEMPVKRFEYKYSFKPPYLAQKDGTVPFFTHYGNAIASEENLRITPSLKSQKGSIWSKLQTTFDWWEVEIVFRVTGRGRIGADGLAFWYTDPMGHEGPVFGSSDQWNGLAIFFDSFDNDNKHNNPYIMAMVNDGTKLYDHHNDGSTQQIAGCLRDFRNKPFPVKAKIQYFKNILSLLIHSGMSNNENDYEMCMRVENVFLPARGYFGLSAATGGLADDHDVQKFMTWSIVAQPDGFQPPGVQIPSEEQQKFEQEFENYQHQLDKKKEEYIKEHPEAKEKEEEEWFEEEQIRELRQIFQGQSDLRVLVQTLSKKLDEIVGRQETTISLVSSIQMGGGGGVAPPAHPTQTGLPLPPTPIQRHEVDNLLTSSRDLLAATREIKNFLSSISTKQDQILARPSPSSPSSASPDYSTNFHELRESMGVVKRDLSLVSQRVLSQPHPAPVPQIPACPTINCVSTTWFVGLGVTQLLLLLIYALIKNRKEKEHKKFY